MIRLFLSRSSAAGRAAHRLGGEGADAVAAGALGFVKRLVGLVHQRRQAGAGGADRDAEARGGAEAGGDAAGRSEEHTSELQSLMRISYAVFCLKKKKKEQTIRLDEQ